MKVQCYKDDIPICKITCYDTKEDYHKLKTYTVNHKATTKIHNDELNFSNIKIEIRGER